MDVAPREGLLSRRCLVLSGLIGLAVFAPVPPLASAHGTPDKVVGDVVVTLVPIPSDAGTALRFFFRDLPGGQPLRVPITIRARLRSDPDGTLIEESPQVTTATGTGEFVTRVPVTGRVEVLLEFERADRRGQTYRPDDWLIAIGPAARTSWVPALSAAASGAVIVLGIMSRRRHTRDAVRPQERP